MNSIIHGIYMNLLMSEKMDEKDPKTTKQNNNDDKKSEPLLGEDDSSTW